MLGIERAGCRFTASSPAKPYNAAPVLKSGMPTGRSTSGAAEAAGLVGLEERGLADKAEHSLDGELDADVLERKVDWLAVLPRDLVTFDRDPSAASRGV